MPNEDKDLPVEMYELAGKSLWQKTFTSLLTADWTAYYTARIAGANPEDVPIIKELKNRLKN